MQKFEDLQEQINSYIEQHVLRAKRKPRNLYEPVEYILSIGGKRLRPALVLMAANLYTSQLDRFLPQALAMEVFHNFTLLHDDIMDNSDMRRSQPTVHVKWNQNTAILSGDAMSFWAYEFFADCAPQILPTLLKIFTRTALEVCEGQQYDMDFEQRLDVSEQQYLRMIELKTSVLIAASLEIGAHLAHAGETDARLLYDFGKNIGMAFQLQDDLLDTFGNQQVFGKPIGGDIVANKKTYLLVKALEKTRGEDHEKLRGLLSQDSLSRQQKIDSVTEIYNSVNIRSCTQNKMDEFYENAIQSLQKVDVPESQKRELRSFAARLMVRQK